MRKILVSIMVFSLAMLLLTACGSKQNTVPTPGASATGDGTMQQATDKTQVDTSKFIGEEKAKETMSLFHDISDIASKLLSE